MKGGIIKIGDIISLNKLSSEVKLLAQYKIKIISVGKNSFKFTGEASGVKVPRMKIKDLDLKITNLTTIVNNLTTTVNKLAITVQDGFKDLKKDIKDMKNTPTMKAELLLFK